MTALENHSRTIIHIDIDCFYAQVEETKNPKLKDLPLGIQQKNIVVTSNYKAREYGVTKCMPLSEATKLCPELVLVNGEDLHDYRQISYKLTNLLQKYTPMVERLGLDENFMDVTELVAKKRSSNQTTGNIFGDLSEKCDCGCYERLRTGTDIASEIRGAIKDSLNLTTCAGIAHNKILAKLAGAANKPNQQTVIFPHSAQELLLSLKTLRSIPGIGESTAQNLEKIHVTTIAALQDAPPQKLEPLFGADKAKIFRNLSLGIDPSPVKTSGKPHSIGLEDSCKSISIQTEIKEKLQRLLTRLLVLVKEDGRVPKTVKLTIRKFDKATKSSHRETKQCNIVFLATNPAPKIITTVMHLFSRLVDLKKPYHVTLLGLSFTKFCEAPRSSIAAFLTKNLEVQAVTSIENLLEAPGSPLPSTSRMGLLEEDSPSPSPKKLKLENVGAKKRCFEEFLEDCDCESPSKLKVADLSLESVSCPPDADLDVFKELPDDIQKELWEDYRRRSGSFCANQVKKAKPNNTLLNYFIRNK